MTCFKEGFGVPGHHVHVLRNHRVGRTCKRGWLRSAITHADLDQDVLGCLLGILDEDIEVAIAR